MGLDGQKGEPGIIGDHGLPGALGMKGEKGLPGAPGGRVSFSIVIWVLCPLDKLAKLDVYRVGTVSPDLRAHLVAKVIEVTTDWTVFLVGQDKKENPVMMDLWGFQDCEDHLVHQE